MSDAKDKAQPVIVVRRGGKHGAGHHGGAWKVAYADFVTAMMAFFLVMWLVTQSDIVKKAVEGYFQDPANFQKNYRASVLNGGAGVLKSNMAQVSQQPSPPPKEPPQNEIEDAAAQMRQAIEALAGLNIPKDLLDIEMTREGMRIQLIEGSDEIMFFKPGSAVLTPQGEVILKAIGMELGKLPNRLVIEGHTDGSDLARADGYSNWELSADRANVARRVMMSSGLASGQVREVRGFAGNRLRVQSDPLDPRNRRITIVVLNQLTGQSSDSEDYETPIVLSRGQ